MPVREPTQEEINALRVTLEAWAQRIQRGPKIQEVPREDLLELFRINLMMVEVLSRHPEKSQELNQRIQATEEQVQGLADREQARADHFAALIDEFDRLIASI